jgi:hypothetical protein
MRNKITYHKKKNEKEKEKKKKKTKNLKILINATISQIKNKNIMIKFR